MIALTLFDYHLDWWTLYHIAWTELAFVVGLWLGKKDAVKAGDNRAAEILLQSELASRQMHDLTRQAFVAMTEEAHKARR